MLNIHELERRWLIYKIKSYIPLVLSITGALAVIVLVFIFLPLITSIIPVKVTQESNITQAKASSTVITKDQPIEQTLREVPQNTQGREEKSADTSLVLKPSLHFMDKIEESLPTYIEDDYAQTENSKQSIPAISQYKMNEPNRAVEIQENESPAIIEEKKSMLTITKQEDKSDLKDIIRRFKNNKNPALSLFIAKRYYAAGEYQKSYNYALMTNEIDKNIEESWIVFAKSLVKLGQHELAMNTLKAYLKTSKSTTAEVLLKNIESGAFR